MEKENNSMKTLPQATVAAAWLIEINVDSRSGTSVATYVLRIRIKVPSPVCRIWKQLTAVIRANMIEVRRRNALERDAFTTPESVIEFSCRSLNLFLIELFEFVTFK